MSDRIVIGYDGSPSADHAIEAARGLLTAELAVIVTVWEPALPVLPLMAGDGLGTMQDVDPETARELDELSEDRGERLAQQGARLALEAGFSTEVVVVADERNVAETLAEVAAEQGAAAIVVGCKGHSALHDRLLGSTSSGLLHRAGRPVLVVPRP